MALMKKRNSRLKAILVIAILFWGIVSFGHNNTVLAATKSLTSTQITDYFNERVGQQYPNNLCLKFVAEGFQALGAQKSSTCCAYNYGSSHIQSNDINNIPIGADVFFGNCAKGPCKNCRSAYYGHIGVYVGNGYFVHATGGRVQKTPLSSWRNKYRGWGTHGNISIISNSNSVPSINSVKITGIDSAVVNFSFSVNNGTLAKVVIQSTLTGETINASYTSGLSNINYSFNRNDMPTGGSQYYIYLYAYSGSANNYKNEQVYKMTYGSTAQCVTFPDTLDNNQAKSITFNYKFYADLYKDLKTAYGYDEAILYKHWITYGIKEGRIASPAYCSSFYLKNNSDLAAAYGDKNYAKAYFHYTTYGIKEGRDASPAFSAKHYLSKNGDIVAAYGNNNFLMATMHFNTYGINEERDASPYYFSQYYRNKNADLRSMNNYQLILHYMQYGISERRIANSGMRVPNM